MSKNPAAAGHAVPGFDPLPAAARADNGVVLCDSGTAAVSGADVVITQLLAPEKGDAITIERSAGRPLAVKPERF
jgi:3-hydroxyisobutyrate dehydrogenase-like beta-hydroxyacid dehydrogenase